MLPPRSPNVNAHCERFVRSIKEEALEQMVMLGERSLYHVIHEYLTYYHTERNHQGLDNRLIASEGAVGCQTGPVVRRERLRWTAQLLPSRGRLTRRNISTKRGDRDRRSMASASLIS
jgi:transposase InsO family protein